MESEPKRNKKWTPKCHKMPQIHPMQQKMPQMPQNAKKSPYTKQNKEKVALYKTKRQKMDAKKWQNGFLPPKGTPLLPLALRALSPLRCNQGAQATPWNPAYIAALAFCSSMGPSPLCTAPPLYRCRLWPCSEDLFANFPKRKTGPNPPNPLPATETGEETAVERVGHG